MAEMLNVPDSPAQCTICTVKCLQQTPEEELQEGDASVPSGTSSE